MELSLATPLESRDGSLAKDAKLLNCFWEPNSEGHKVVTKRPGLTAIQTVIAGGFGQGMVSQGVIDFAIVGDTLYQIMAAGVGPFALPGVTTANQRMSVLNANLLASGVSTSFIKSTSSAWVMSSLAIPTKVGSANYPAVTVPGAAYLDGTYYVMTPAGVIYGSALEDPTSWTALNFISTDRGLGPGIALARHLNYVVAFCERGIQFFYDAGNPGPGSPLSSVLSATSTVGCEHGDSIAEINGLTYFWASDKSRGKGIAVLNGLSVQFVSDGDLGRILGAFTPQPSSNSVYSMALTTEGHSFYLLTSAADNVTLAYDIRQNAWAQWSSSPDGVVDNAFGPGFMLRTHSGASLALLDRTTGVVSTLQRTGAESVRMLIRTRVMDAGSTCRKSLSELSLIGDTVNASMAVRYSNDDGQTWSTARNLSLATFRKRLTRLGSFFRRSFEFSYFGNSPIRLESMVLPDRNLPAQAVPQGE